MCFTELYRGLRGHMVTVKMTNGETWEGRFHACESEGDIELFGCDEWFVRVDFVMLPKISKYFIHLYAW